MQSIYDVSLDSVPGLKMVRDIHKRSQGKQNQSAEAFVSFRLCIQHGLKRY